MVTSFSSLNAYLSTIPMPDPCHPIPNGEECSTFGYELAPSSVVVTVASNYSHGDEGEQLPLTIGGMPASFDRPNAPVATRADTRLEWRIAMPDSAFAWYLITADIRGPRLEELTGQVTRMIDRLAFDPQVVPLPAELAVRDAEAARILVLTIDQLMRDSAAYRCFPRVPGAVLPARLAEIPMNAPLARPVHVTCRSEVVATPLQMWRVILTIEFADPADGEGPIVTDQWVTREGTLGAMTQRTGAPPP